jgi:AraC family transcriptional regulator of adaptative response/methylated-DNA-[protein]-cysteine methyltransferase
MRIPEGAVISYGDFATRLGRPGAARAVAGAVAGNLIGYVIPCHRVIRDSGAISGYRWDPVRKSALLGMEAARNEGANAHEHIIGTGIGCGQPLN